MLSWIAKRVKVNIVLYSAVRAHAQAEVCDIVNLTLQNSSGRENCLPLVQI